MRFLVLMSDNRKLSYSIENASYWSMTAYVNKIYCDKHGYDFIYVNTYSSDPTIESDLYNCKSPTGAIRHAAWGKILSVLNLLKNFTHDFVVYIDTDCIFKNFSLKLESIVAGHQDANFFFLNNKPWSSVLPCTGFFICKNDQRTIDYLNKWYSVNIPQNDVIHPWEQNALYKIWPLIRTQCVLIDEWMFREEEGQFLRHIGSNESQLRIPYFLEVVKSLEPSNGEIKNVLSSIETKSLDTCML